MTTAHNCVYWLCNAKSRSWHFLRFLDDSHDKQAKFYTILCTEIYQKYTLSSLILTLLDLLESHDLLQIEERNFAKFYACH